LGEFSLFWAILYFGQFFCKGQKKPKRFGKFSIINASAFILRKNGLGYILGDFFSQTHLVTLLSTVISAFMQLD
jgi:hypothetical protein